VIWRFGYQQSSKHANERTNVHVKTYMSNYVFLVYLSDLLLRKKNTQQQITRGNEWLKSKLVIRKEQFVNECSMSPTAVT